MRRAAVDAGERSAKEEKENEPPGQLVRSSTQKFQK